MSCYSKLEFTCAEASGLHRRHFEHYHDNAKNGHRDLLFELDNHRHKQMILNKLNPTVHILNPIAKMRI